MNAPLVRGPDLVRLEGERKLAIDVARNRLIVAGALFAVAFAVIGGRLIQLSVFHPAAEPTLARERAPESVLSGRADITDRNGVLLATSLATASLYADPKKVIDVNDAAARLVKALPDLGEATVRAKLRSKRRFVWLRRHLTPDQQYEINRLGIPGIDFQREERRVYPLGRLAGHVLGHTDVDNRGIAGVEGYFDENLRARPAPFEVSLDVRIQHAMQRELAKAMNEFRAVGAAGIVLDARNGEILAMVSLPDFDPNRSSDIDANAQFNRTTLGVYEMGSTFKIFTTAIALETRTVGIADGYDATRPIRISRYWIRDHSAKRRWLSVPEIFIYSSNIGAAKMALAVGGARQRAFMGRLGLLGRSPVELVEVGAPLTPDRWRDVNTMTIGFGHGMAVSPVQLTSAVAAVINGGVLYPPTLLRRSSTNPIVGTRVLSSATSDKMRRLMRLAVEHGTGRFADAHGYLVGGKTGTAEKVAGRAYAHKTLLSSFVAAFPMHAPRYVVFAMLDEARGNARTHGYATGGWVAAPAVGRVIARIGPMLGVPRVDEGSNALKRRMAVQVMTEKDGVRRVAFE
jgi:cell division protein FtsI (penicillin-binding protein 3)